VKGSLLSRIDGHIGVPRAVLQPYAASAAAAFGLARDDFVPLRRANFPVSRPGTFVPRLDWFLREGATPSAAPTEAKLKANPGAEVRVMLSWVVTFLIIALIAGLLGFGGIAGTSIEIAKVIFFIAVILFLVSAVLGVVRGKRV
jgi:uncharacterized membrane protein YtjA (UPF0391 family)